MLRGSTEQPRQMGKEALLCTTTLNTPVVLTLSGGVSGLGGSRRPLRDWHPNNIMMSPRRTTDFEAKERK